ncbi:hypothetical protein [Ferroacidibacillus organovorans]|uniref:Roadblock/LAMTOR2 domain-containing protein n=1 Tax=Ferroacidibacillus organovorans TaxID=1765683 RepID=A0A117SYN6_9BACL|nr:hypothetical protein [Ferroacidibacillus organovorans]KUO97221.1 hypothetical protein ATW55_09925 [Ferroacidibacillus organovorans]
MSGSVLYFAIGIIVIAVVAVLLIVWSIRQIRRGEALREAGEQKFSPVHETVETVDESAQKNERVDVTATQSGERTMQRDAREVLLASGRDTHTSTRAIQRDAREVLRALRASQEERSERPDVAHEDVVGQASPMILLQQDVDASFAALSEDHILGLSVLSQEAEPVEGETETPLHAVSEEKTPEDGMEPPLPSIDLKAYLSTRLADPSVLGYMVIDEKGNISVSDQTYDPELSELFGTLVADAKRTADTVGLASRQEVIVRGEEGLIYLLPLAQLEVAKRPVVEDERFLVVFLDPQEGSLDDVARVLLHPTGTAEERAAKDVG